MIPVPDKLIVMRQVTITLSDKAIDRAIFSHGIWIK